jgi:hypothetical protein
MNMGGFAEVLERVDRVLDFDDCVKRFQSLIRLHKVYSNNGNHAGIQSVENLIKNDVGIRRLARETEDFGENTVDKQRSFKMENFLVG